MAAADEGGAEIELLGPPVSIRVKEEKATTTKTVEGSIRMARGQQTANEEEGLGGEVESSEECTSL